jgi:hypothetical protein
VTTTKVIFATIAFGRRLDLFSGRGFSIRPASFREGLGEQALFTPVATVTYRFNRGSRPL